MISIKKLLTKILSYFKIVSLYSANIYPINTGWMPTYITIPNLGQYNTIYVRVSVYGTVLVLTFPRFDNAPTYTQYFDDAYLASGVWTFSRLRVDVDWQNNRVGVSAINGATDQMYIYGIWGTNKI